MKIRLLLIAGKNERITAMATEALGSAFPGSELERLSTLKEALKTQPARVPEMIVIEAASADQIAEATQARDEQNLPRWAVVASGSAAPGPSAEVIPDSEWSPGHLARVFRTSIALHQLRRDKERLLGDLLSVGVRVTHDLRTPLGGIFSATEALEDLQGKGPNTDRSATQPILESAQDLVRIINQLTLVAKSTARPHQGQAFNMGTPAGRALERVEARAHREGAVVSRPASWPEVCGDPAKTESVWLLLLENALRHAGKRPGIELGWEPVADGFKFWVRDNGPGVPEEKRRQLFQPFHRLHETNAGRGLGLSIAARLVELQGGRCGYEAAGQVGACFYFTLPAPRAA
jgi:signal transduction histidine kinase